VSHSHTALKAALAKAVARYESLMAAGKNCGDPDCECPMQDSGKPYHMAGELEEFRALLSGEVVSDDLETSGKQA